MLGLRLLSNIVRSAFERKYGPELVTNGSFASSGSGWSVSGESTINTGAGRVYSSAGAYSEFHQLSVFTVSAQYLVTYTVVSTNGASVANLAGNIVWQTTTTGTKKQVITATETGLYFKRVSGVTDVTIDDISVKRIL